MKKQDKIQGDPTHQKFFDTLIEGEPMTYDATSRMRKPIGSSRGANVSARMPPPMEGTGIREPEHWELTHPMEWELGGWEAVDGWLVVPWDKEKDQPFVQDKESKLFVPGGTDKHTHRRSPVLAVGPCEEIYEVGDIVVYRADIGIPLDLNGYPCRVFSTDAVLVRLPLAAQKVNEADETIGEELSQ